MAGGRYAGLRIRRDLRRIERPIPETGLDAACDPSAQSDGKARLGSRGDSELHAAVFDKPLPKRGMLEAELAIDGGNVLKPPLILLRQKPTAIAIVAGFPERDGCSVSLLDLLVGMCGVLTLREP